MSDKPDFDALRAKRDRALANLVEAAFPGATIAHVNWGGGTPTCYCACPEGPCEHDFGGWREFDDGLGGEAFCQRCGMGAMAHDERTAP